MLFALQVRKAIASGDYAPQDRRSLMRLATLAIDSPNSRLAKDLEQNLGALIVADRGQAVTEIGTALVADATILAKSMLWYESPIYGDARNGQTAGEIVEAAERALAAEASGAITAHVFVTIPPMRAFVTSIT